MSSSRFKLGMCQMLVGATKSDNIAKAVKMVGEAKAKGAQLVVLPECFNSPYGTKYFAKNAEPLDASGETFNAMSAASKEHGVWLVAGSIPERRGDKLYNACAAFNPQGELVDVFRKMHLFCIRSEALTVDEGEVLTAGDRPVVIDIAAGGPCDMPVGFKVGLGVCFDVRFPQLSLHYAAEGTSLLVFPSAFSTVTGPKYWRPLAQARAIDAQQFVVMASIARDPAFEYVAWGHSLCSDPAGDVQCEMDESEGVTVTEVDLSKVEEIRQRLPVLSGTRNDVYRIDFHGSRPTE